MPNPFLQYDPSARSLNRAKIVALSGLNPPDGIIGMRGYPGLSAESLQQKIRAQASNLNLNPNSLTLIRDLESAFSDPVVGWQASEIAQDYGIQLGYLLLMLKRGDAENRAARPDWTEAHWVYWAHVRNVMFGGGLMAGKFGRKALVAATNVLAAHGFPRMNLQASPYGGDIGLVGLAYLVREGDTLRGESADSALLFDFGQTNVKRAVVELGEHGINAMQHLPPVRAECYERGANRLQPQARWEWMLNIIRESWHPVAAIGIALAAYLENGQPVASDNGCYGSLQQLTEHLPTFMRDQLRERLAIDVPITLCHDGTAAAAAHADLNGVVITLGTALGIGFPEEQISTATHSM